LTGPSTRRTSNAPPPTKTNTPPPKQEPAKSKQSSDLSDIDDILAGMDSPSTPQKFSFQETVNSGQNTRSRPVTQRVSQAFREDFDDIDSLLNGLGNDDFLNPPVKKAEFADIDDLLNDIGNPTPPQRKSNLSDIDDILSDLSISSSTTTKKKSFDIDDDIDALINDMARPTPSAAKKQSKQTTTGADIDAIDDLLAELQFSTLG